METLPITLIVKAPNQQIEDQTIKCELTWTINKLKQHLSEVYPSRPAKHEQKLIYSGQLLNDSAMLKDVLRQYDGQKTHTVHLVCTSRQSLRREAAPAAPAAPQQARVPPPQVAPAAPQTAPDTTSNASSAPNSTWPNPAAPMNPNTQYAAQFLMMQQAYMEYMTQYMQLAANSYGHGAIPAVHFQNLQNGLPTAEQQPPAQPQQQQQQQQEPEFEVPDGPDLQERDWLDIFYMFSRIMVLFSVVYFYSSPLRFIFVVVLGFFFYVYQVGFFRNINNNNNNTVPGGEAEHRQQEQAAPSRLMVVWTFFATFFASLIPEVPNAPI